MNILIIGLGSIGQRHLRNLKLIEPKSKFYAIRKTNNVPLLNHCNRPIEGDIKKKYSIRYFKTISKICESKIKIDCAFVCTPSSKHISQVIELSPIPLLLRGIYFNKLVGSDKLFNNKFF